MKDVQCYELFGGIALKIHTFSFFSYTIMYMQLCLGSANMYICLSFHKNVVLCINVP